MLLPRRRRLRATVLATSLVALVVAAGCAGGMDPDPPAYPQPQPQPPASGNGWVCTLATCGGKCINNVCYPSDYQPPADPNDNTPNPGGAPSNPPPSTGNCPDPSVVTGSYEGTINGNIKSIIDVQVTGKVTFSVVDDGNGGLKIDSGQVFGKAMGINFSLPMNGTVNCGKLAGTGSGTLIGVAVDGTFNATFSATTKKFEAGTWSGNAPSNGSSGGGAWSAAQL